MLNLDKQFSSTATLVLLCKRPAIGVGKQRLAARFGTETARQVAEALLACAMEDVCAWHGPVVIAPSSTDDVTWASDLSELIPSPVEVVPQADGNLGQRINELDRELRKQGMKQLIFIGSDSPGLNMVNYAEVLHAMQQTDVVLIPAMDGGVTLMASNSAWPDIAALPWSSNQLCAALMNACHQANQSLTLLDYGYDIDEPEDLVKLTTALLHDQRPARHALWILAQSVVSRL